MKHNNAKLFDAESDEEVMATSVLFTMVWRITRWTRNRQPLPSTKELRAHKDRSMGKAVTSHVSYTFSPLLKGHSDSSLSVKNP